MTVTVSENRKLMDILRMDLSDRGRRCYICPYNMVWQKISPYAMNGSVISRF